MRARRLTLLFLLYVTADLSNPLMPGAFNFNADECVEVASAYRQDAGRPRATSIRIKSNTPDLKPRNELLRPEHHATGPWLAFGEWFVDLRRAHASFHEPPSATDDH